MKWSEKELEYVKKNAGIISVSQMSAELNRSFYSVKTKIVRLRLVNLNRSWSSEDTNWLIENYPFIEMSKLMQKLGRSDKSIYMQANILGLKKDPEFIRQRAKEKLHSSFIEKQYKKGNISHNKGVPMSAEKYEKCKATMFKVGHNVHNENPEGDGAITLRNNKAWIS